MLAVSNQSVGYTRKYDTNSRFLMICERTSYVRPSRNKIVALPRTRNETNVLEKNSRSAGTDFYSSTHVPGLAAPTAQHYS